MPVQVLPYASYGLRLWSMSEMNTEGDDLGQLVMAMPRRELFALKGIIQNVSLPVLESLQHEHWFALPEVIADDLEAKEVRIGLLVERDSQYLVDNDGVLLHAAEVPPEVEHFGAGLLGLKNLAVSAGRELMQSDGKNIQLWGYLNEDSLIETRPYFILIYKMIASDDCQVPDEMKWVGIDDFDSLALDPASALFAEVLSGKSSPGSAS